MQESKEIEELRKQIAKCNLVITSLEHNDGFRQVLEDFEVQRKLIDDNWQYTGDKDKLEEMRITKMAVLSILNTLDNYRADLKKAEAELIKLENPDQLIDKEWDNE